MFLVNHQLNHAFGFQGVNLFIGQTELGQHCHMIPTEVWGWPTHFARVIGKLDLKPQNIQAPVVWMLNRQPHLLMLGLRIIKNFLHVEHTAKRYA